MKCEFYNKGKCKSKLIIGNECIINSTTLDNGQCYYFKEKNDKKR